MTDKEIVDIHALKERVQGDTGLLADIVGIFLERSPEAMANIQRAIVAEDTRSLEATAHSLRGYLVSFHADRASETALQLEIKGRLNDCAGIRHIFSKLEEEMELLKPILAQCTSL